MLEEIFKDNNYLMKKSIDSLQKSFSTLRMGKVTTNIIDHITIDYYGTATFLSQVANIIVLDGNTISISPWEKNFLSNIEKAIQEANIGVNANNDGDFIKLFFPPMTIEQREIIAKQAKQMSEKAKVSIRNIRKENNGRIKQIEKNKEINQDEMKKALDDIQKFTDKYINEINNMLKIKEVNILKV